MRYDLAIFDLDGTLADSFPFFIDIQNQLARRHGFAEVAPHEVERLRELTPRELMRHVGLSRWKLPFVTRGFIRLMGERRDPVPLFEGVADAIVDLERAGVALAVVTSNSVDNARRTLGDAHCARMRRLEGGASMFAKHRRLRRVLRATAVPAGRAIYVGDQVPDADAAHAAGMAFGAVTWGYASAGRLRGCRPAMVFEQPADLRRIAG